MKKIISIFVILVLVFSLTACGEQKAPVENNGEASQEEQGAQLKNPDEVSINEFYFPIDNLNKYEVVQVIHLKENPTTGYGWQYKIADESIAVVESDEYVPDAVEDGVVGAGGMHAYRLNGLKEGTTQIVFDYMRSWEGEESSVETVAFDLIVDSDLKIAIVSEIH